MIISVGFVRRLILSFVKVVAITSSEVGGKAGVRVDMASVEPPVIRGQSQPSDEEYVSDVAIKVMSGLQQTGIFPKLQNLRLSLFLTMEEYGSLGKPQINDVLEMTVLSNKIEFIPVGRK